MSHEDVLEGLMSGLVEVPMLDAHTHLVGGKLGARGLHDILLYHMLISDLYAAGCPSGARLTEYPGWPAPEEARARITEAIPYLRHTRNTSMSWGLRILLRDLYDWDQEITLDNWQILDGRVRERADDRAWHREVIRKTGIRKLCTELARREAGPDGTGPDDDLLHYSLEWAFFTRSQWGEYDTALYELERCWGRPPESPAPIGGTRPPTDRVIRTLEDVQEAVDWFVDHIPADQVVSNATHISTDIDYRPVDDATMENGLARRGAAGPPERDLYASYINEAFLTAFEKRFGSDLLFQFSTAAEPLPHETASRMEQRTLGQLAEMMARHPRVQFQCHVSSAHANQTLCTMCRELPNLSLAGYWWHNFFPSIMARVMEERLDMLPTNKQVGFLSDAYCIEWTYAKTVMVRRLLAEVLAKKVGLGLYDVDTALAIARDILFEAPQHLCGMVPAY
jgi:hypothetical protein